MKTILYNLLLLFLLITSCSDKPEDNNDYKFNLISSEQIRIPIDSAVSPFFFQSQYLKQQNQLIIANRNLDDESLLILDLDEKKITKKISYKNEGKNDVQRSSGAFYYHNKDSIFLIGPHNKKFYITNDFGEVKKTIPLKDAVDVLDEIGQPLLLMGTSSGHYENGIITFVTYPINANNMSDSESDPAIVHLDIDNERITRGSLTYATSIKNDIKQHPEYIMPLLVPNKDEQLIILFRLSNELIIYNLKDKTFLSKPFKSDFFNTYDKMKSYDEIPSFLIESFSNKKLLFNEVNNYTYLFVSHKIPLIDGEEKVENTIYSKPFSILIFNKKYEKIYEKKFDGNIYNVELSFITNKEVFLSLNNPKNENFDENYFGYEIFQLKNKN